MTDKESTRLWYIRPNPLYGTEKPYHIFEDVPRDAKASNLEFDVGPLQIIRDIRGHEDEYDLEKHGFTFRSRKLPPLDWDDENEINLKYISDTKEALAETLGSQTEIKSYEVFDWRLRKSGSTNTLQDPSGDRMVKISPARIVHIDQSPAGVLDRMRKHFGFESAKTLIRDSRVQIFNTTLPIPLIWRPLVDVVADMPLTLCDARTVNGADLIEVAFINSDSVRRSYMVKYSEDFRFYYLSKMTKDEICIFKVFDSAEVESKWVPHSAFEHQNVPLGSPPRESIEVRLLVVWNEKEHVK